MAFALSIFGCVLGASLIGLIRLDDWFYRTGRETISERLLSLEGDGIAGLLGIVAMTFTFGLIWGGLGGHLWWPQNDRNMIWAWAFCSVCLGMAVGFFIGHDWFGQ